MYTTVKRRCTRTVLNHSPSLSSHHGFHLSLRGKRHFRGTVNLPAGRRSYLIQWSLRGDGIKCVSVCVDVSMHSGETAELDWLTLWECFFWPETWSNTRPTSSAGPSHAQNMNVCGGQKINPASRCVWDINLNWEYFWKIQLSPYFGRMFNFSSALSSVLVQHISLTSFCLSDVNSWHTEYTDRELW